jgi:Protein of unknown function (DUF2970)
MSKAAVEPGARRWSRNWDAMKLLKMIRIVLWSFFGIRNAESHRADIADVKLSLLVLVAVLVAAGFGATLFAIAKVAIKVAH